MTFHIHNPNSDIPSLSCSDKFFDTSKVNWDEVRKALADEPAGKIFQVPTNWRFSPELGK